MSAPPAAPSGASPANQLYLGPAGGAPQQPPSFFSWLWNQQIMNPEHRQGNLSIARALGIFAAGVVFARSEFASALVPVF